MDAAQTIDRRLGYAAVLDEGSIQEAIEFAAAHGFAAVELNMNIPVFLPENYTPHDRRGLRDLSARKGVSMTMHAPEDISLMSPHRLLRRAGVERICEIACFAQDTGASRVTIHIGNSVYFTMPDGKIPLHDVYPDRYRDALKESLVAIRDHCAARVTVCVENVEYFGRRVVQEVVGDLLREGDLYLTWDIGHSYDAPEQETFMRENLHYIRNCHVHDHDGKHSHKVLGAGKMDLPSYFRLLASSDTYFIFEVRPRENALLCLEYYRRSIRPLL
jgi:sugar phosphate isomerase/epimerase